MQARLLHASSSFQVYTPKPHLEIYRNTYTNYYYYYYYYFQYLSGRQEKYDTTLNMIIIVLIKTYVAIGNLPYANLHTHHFTSFIMFLFYFYYSDR